MTGEPDGRLWGEKLSPLPRDGVADTSEPTQSQGRARVPARGVWGREHNGECEPRQCLVRGTLEAGGGAREEVA
jgi:hypothetical protein